MRKKLTAYRHAVWDWNGTLLDDTWLCCEALNQILAEEKRTPLDPHRYRQIFEFPAIKVYEKLGFTTDQLTFESLSARFMAAYEKKKAQCQLHAQARDLLKHLSHCGLTHSILSAYEHRLLHQTLSEHKLSDIFIKTCGSGDIFAGSKEHRAKNHLHDLSLQPEEVIYLGDTAHDFEAAQAMGTDCILIAHGYQERERLEGLGARVVNNFNELLEELTTAG